MLGSLQGTGEVESVVKLKYMFQGVYRLTEQSGHKLNIFFMTRYQMVTNAAREKTQHRREERALRGRSYLRWCDQGRPLCRSCDEEASEEEHPRQKERHVQRSGGGVSVAGKDQREGPCSQHRDQREVGNVKD